MNFIKGRSLIREVKKKHFDGLNPHGGGGPPKSNVPVFLLLLSPLFMFFPSSHDICHNWYSKQTLSTFMGGGGGGGFRVHMDLVHKNVFF